MMATNSPPASSSIKHRRRIPFLLSLLENRPVCIALFIRILLVYALPSLLDDGLLLKGVRYTDIDYDVFTDAAVHVSRGRSPYDRHTYRYTPFLAQLLALPMQHHDVNGSSSDIIGRLWNVFFSMRYFGKILFCVADVICGYIIVVLRRRQRLQRLLDSDKTTPIQATSKTIRGSKQHCHQDYSQYATPKLTDALWWLYNPLPINICTRGSAESLVALLPVLATVAITDVQISLPSSTSLFTSSSTSSEIDKGGASPCSIGGKSSLVIARACIAGILHGIGIHFKLYPVIYTISFMANFSRQQQQQQQRNQKYRVHHVCESATDVQLKNNVGWKYLLSDYCSETARTTTFPWTNPTKIVFLTLIWVQRLFFTLSSILFLIVSVGTVGSLTYFAVQYYGQKALDEGLLYHFQRVDHRHNYSMYWYWIYLARGREAVAAATSQHTTSSVSFWGYIPIVPQILILGFSSLGIAPYDLSFALFCQTFAFVAFNKVITAQYFTWYLCLLPLCSDRVNWQSKRMLIALGILFMSIVVWLLSAFTLEMLGWRTHRHVWLASLFFFIANVNLLHSIVMGYKRKGMVSCDDARIQKLKES